MSYPNDDEPRWTRGRHRNLHPDAVELLAGPPKVVVTPLAGINSATHYTRCAEMADDLNSWCEAERQSYWNELEPYTPPEITAWFAYLAGSTNERPA